MAVPLVYSTAFTIFRWQRTDNESFSFKGYNKYCTRTTFQLHLHYGNKGFVKTLARHACAPHDKVNPTCIFECIRDYSGRVNAAIRRGAGFLVHATVVKCTFRMGFIRLIVLWNAGFKLP